jgi:N-acetylmuramoyl-L-alanine amidase
MNNDKLVVCLDAGHGGEDSGAQYNGIIESGYNFDFVQRCGNRLKSLSEPIVVRRTRHYPTETLSLVERGNIVRDLGAHLVISIHVNAAASKELHGAMAFYSKDVGPSDACRKVCAAFLSAVPEPLRRRYEEPRNVLNESSGDWLQRPRNVIEFLSGDIKWEGPKRPHVIPTVLFELGFCSNDEDARALKNPVVRSSLMTAVQCAVERWRVIQLNH